MSFLLEDQKSCACLFSPMWECDNAHWFWFVALRVDAWWIESVWGLCWIVRVLQEWSLFMWVCFISFPLPPHNYHLLRSPWAAGDSLYAVKPLLIYVYFSIFKLHYFYFDKLSIKASTLLPALLLSRFACWVFVLQLMSLALMKSQY